MTKNQIVKLAEAATEWPDLTGNFNLEPPIQLRLKRTGESCTVSAVGRCHGGQDPRTEMVFVNTINGKETEGWYQIAEVEPVPGKSSTNKA